MLQPASVDQRLMRTGTFVFLVSLVFFGALVYWQVFRTDLAEGEGNPRVLQAFSDPGRGRILDRNGVVLAESAPDGTRRYPEPSVAHVIGYLDARYGTQGAELAFNSELAGTSGEGGLAEAIEAEFRRTSRRGLDVRLTIDVRVQRAAVAALGGRPGAVVAIDPRNGEVLALVSEPTYDPGTLAELGEQLLNDPSAPLLNRATQGLYPPGSTFKTVTAVSALESRLLTPETRVTCPGEVVIDGFPVSCRNTPQGVGTYPFANAYVFSVNGIFAQVGDELGWDRLLATARRFGFGSAPPFTLETAASQLIAPGSEATRPLLASTAFGQGELLATPLQMALVAAAVANEGVFARPHLGLAAFEGRRRVASLAESGETRAIDASVARTMKDLMARVVSNNQANGLADVGGQVAGKTGTAETGSGTSHAWFIAFAPVQEPVVAVAVVVEDGGQGGVVASPIAGQVIAAVLGR